MRFALVASVLLAISLSGCGGSSQAEREVEPVTFEAADGLQLAGRLYGEGGEGGVGVVLAHMGRAGDSLKDWDARRAPPFPRRLPRARL